MRVRFGECVLDSGHPGALPPGEARPPSSEGVPAARAPRGEPAARSLEAGASRQGLAGDVRFGNHDGRRGLRHPRPDRRGRERPQFHPHGPRLRLCLQRSGNEPDRSGDTGRSILFSRAGRPCHSARRRGQPSRHAVKTSPSTSATPPFHDITRGSPFTTSLRRWKTSRSKNGTFIGPSQITQPARLKDGDEIRLGEVFLTFRFVTTADSTKTVERPGPTGRRRLSGPGGQEGKAADKTRSRGRGRPSERNATAKGSRTTPAT